MELTKLKRINNGNPKEGDLPGFADGTLSASLMNNINLQANFGYNNWRTGSPRVDTSMLPTTIGSNTNLASTNAIQRANAAVGATTEFTPGFKGEVSKGGINDLPTYAYLVKPGTGLTGGSKPSQADSAAVGAGPWFAVGSWLGGGVLEGFNRVKTADELLADAGTSQRTVGGISYTLLNAVTDAMKDYYRKKEGDFLTNPARGITGLFLKGRQQREADLAAAKSFGIASALRNSALTAAMRLGNANQYGDSSTQYLYGAKDGKLPSFANGLDADGMIASPYGPIPASVGADARVSNKEIVGKLDDAGNVESVYRVPGKKNNKDTKLAKLANGMDPADRSFVITNKHGLSDYAAASGDYLGALEMQKAYMMNDRNTDLLFRAKNGKLPRFAEGWWGNAIPAAIGALGSIDQYLQAYRNKPYRPNTYAGNPYELNALTTLAGLRVNPYPILSQLRSAESRTNRAIDRSGGLSVGQRNLSRLAALNTTQGSIANTLSSIQQQNNQYKANYASAALNAGNASRQARMQANQWDLDYYSKAHAARQKGMQTAAYNLLNQSQAYAANEFKRNQFNDMMSLYRQDQKNNADYIKQLNDQLTNWINSQLRGIDYDQWIALARKNNWKLS